MAVPDEVLIARAKATGARLLAQIMARMDSAARITLVLCELERAVQVGQPGDGDELWSQLWTELLGQVDEATRRLLVQWEALRATRFVLMLGEPSGLNLGEVHEDLCEEVVTAEWMLSEAG
jgi:hypothetical protein